VGDLGGALEPADYVVGVGASAGGLDALERLLANVPPELPLAFVIAQHLSPEHKSMMAELLRKKTRLAVAEAYENAPLSAGSAYLVPAHANVVVGRDALHLAGRAPSLNLPVDQLLRSLAESHKDRAIAVVLSGTGSDGKEGALAVKSGGGLVLAQDPTTAAFDGMPREVIRSGVADAILSPEDIARELEKLGGDRALLKQIVGKGEPGDAFGRLVDTMRRALDFDLGAYKRSTLLRRLERRLVDRSVTGLDEYTALLREDADEARRLRAELLIGVTEFFRDAAVFGALEAVHLPQLLGRVGAETLRVWVPGCASGEEAYSIAMLLAEQNVDFKLFGTDIDEDGLARATLGRYEEESVAALSTERRKRFFVRRDRGYEVDRELRKRVVFAPHNVLVNPPFTRMNLVSCRNLLIYLTPDAQRRALDAFSYALKPGGVLVLGSSEVIGTRRDDFKTADAHLKIFLRRETKRRFPLLNHRPKPHALAAAAVDTEQAVTAALRVLTDRVTEAAVLVTSELRLLRIFGNAGDIFTLSVGEPSLDVIALLPEALRAVSSIAANRALDTQEIVALPANHPRVALVRAIPFVLKSPTDRFVLLVFESVRAKAPSPSTSSMEHVEALQEELHRARQGLQAAIEELETSNEELQATNEELLAANEELQETNEELQSVNEELHTVNVEHQSRITELSETNADLDNLLNATPIATIFLDEKLRIRRFNPPASKIFPIVEADRGRSLAHFTSTLVSSTPIEVEVQAVLDRALMVEREVPSVSGLRFWMRAVPHVAQRRVCGVVLTFADITALHETREAQELLQGLIDALPANVAVLDDEGIIRFVNAAWLAFARLNGGTGTSVGSSYLDACHTVPELRASIQAVLHGQRSFFGCEYPCHSESEQRWFLMHVERTRDGRHTVVAHTDVTNARKGGT